MREKINVEEAEKAIGMPFEEWRGNCHSVSLGLIKNGLVDEPCRVARGVCKGVPGQHSWIVAGKSCYVDDADIIDPTLWSYADDVDGIWYGSMSDGLHTPHGHGTIWDWGVPQGLGGEEITLDLPKEAATFLGMIPGPHDKAFWRQLLSQAPIQGWPARQFYEAVQGTELQAYVPIDRLGMVTDLNPGGLYLP